VQAIRFMPSSNSLARQVSIGHSSASADARKFGSMMEMMYKIIVQGFERAVSCVNTVVNMLEIAALFISYF
jgi:hypothetical protein